MSSSLLSTGTISLTADTMSLTAQIGGSAAATGQAALVNLAAATSAQAISLGVGAATGLALTDTMLNHLRHRCCDRQRRRLVPRPVTFGSLRAAARSTAGLSLTTLTAARRDDRAGRVGDRSPERLAQKRTGSISQTGGIITAATLTGSSVGGLTLAGTNAIGTLGPLSNTGSGDLSITDNATMTLSGAVSSAGNLTLTTTGVGHDIVLGTSTLVSGTGLIKLISAGAITQALAGVVDPNQLLIQAVGPVTMIGANTVDQLAAQVTGLGLSLTFNNTATNLAVDTVTLVNGITTNGGAVTLSTTTSGNITLNQPIVASGATAIPTVTLTSAGSISEPLTTGTITASGLSVTANGGNAVLEATNAVATVAASVTFAGGAFTFNDPATLLTIGTVNALNGITINGDLNLCSGRVGDQCARPTPRTSGTVRLVDTAAFSQAAAGDYPRPYAISQGYRRPKWCWS